MDVGQQIWQDDNLESVMARGFYLQSCCQQTRAQDCKRKPAVASTIRTEEPLQELEGSSSGPQGFAASHTQFRVGKVNARHREQAAAYSASFSFTKKANVFVHTMVLFFPEVGFLHVVLSVLKKSYSVIYLPCDLDIIFTAQKESVTLC